VNGLTAQTGQRDHAACSFLTRTRMSLPMTVTRSYVCGGFCGRVGSMPNLTCLPPSDGRIGCCGWLSRSGLLIMYW